jgi:hypothetical protein
MCDALRDIYKHEKYWRIRRSSPVEKRDTTLGSHYGLNPFILLGGHGGHEYSIILPRHWESIVHPDYSVTMLFKNPELNGVPDPRVEE